jgi:hypothetical protein
MNSRTLVRVPLLVLLAVLTVGALAGSVWGGPSDATDPARNIAVPCESIASKDRVTPSST